MSYGPSIFDLNRRAATYELQGTPEAADAETGEFASALKPLARAEAMEIAVEVCPQLTETRYPLAVTVTDPVS